MEGRVEDRDVRDTGKEALRLADRGDRGRVVQWGQLGKCPEPALERIVDQSGLAELRTAVDNAVGYRCNVRRCLLQRVERVTRVIRTDERELQARRAGVDDEDQCGQTQSRISWSSSPCSRV